MVKKLDEEAFADFLGMLAEDETATKQQKRALTDFKEYLLANSTPDEKFEASAGDTTIREGTSVERDKYKPPGNIADSIVDAVRKFLKAKPVKIWRESVFLVLCSVAFGWAVRKWGSPSNIYEEVAIDVSINIILVILFVVILFMGVRLCYFGDEDLKIAKDDFINIIKKLGNVTKKIICKIIRPVLILVVLVFIAWLIYNGVMAWKNPVATIMDLL